MIDLPARKRIEANNKRSSLRAELDRWKRAALSDLPQHHTQVASAVTLIEGFLDEENMKLPLDKYTRLILAAHRIWEYFRAKWAQRYSDEMREYLEWADQMAYDCYLPISSIVSKAPPLVFLNGGFSPFVQPRERPFLAESVATQEGISDERAKTAMQKLPFPVIGVPWYQMAHLPDMVSIGHEIGHIVEDDLVLTTDLQRAVGEAVNPARKAYWCAWQRELFADVWGCLSTGPAFPFGLADFLAPTKVWVEPVDASNAYPPAWLRIRFNFEFLAEIQPDFKAEMASATGDWEQYFPAGKSEFLDDVKMLVVALSSVSLPKLGKLTQQYGAGRIGFGTKEYGRAMKQSLVWAPTKTNPQPVDERNMRVLVAAVRLAYDRSPERVSSPPTLASIRTAFNGAVDRSLREAANVVDSARARELLNIFTAE